MIYTVVLGGYRTVLKIEAQNRASAVAQAKHFQNKSLTIGQARELGLVSMGVKNA